MCEDFHQNDSIERRSVTGSKNIPFTGMQLSTLQSRNFTGWGCEGVKPDERKLTGTGLTVKCSQLITEPYPELLFTSNKYQHKVHIEVKAIFLLPISVSQRGPVNPGKQSQTR